MNLQQFRFLREAARQKFNITSAARALHTSQPGISKAIIELEGELGVSIFARQGKRILGLTPPGQQVLLAAERIMQEVDNLKKLARDFAGAPSGTLRIATTHTQARYVLPKVVQAFVRKYPQVRLKLLEANPPQIATMIAGGQADLGIATETLAGAAGLRAIDIYDWHHVAVVPPRHALAKFLATPGKLSLKDLARHPIVTYETQFAGRGKIDAAFAAAGIEPTIVLEAIDADVIKTYVRLGLGIGIVASMSVDPAQDADLVEIDASHLFPAHVTWIGFRRGGLLRKYQLDFMQLFAPHLTRRLIERAAHAATQADVEELVKDLELPTK